MTPKRSRADSHNPTLFEMHKLEQAGRLASSLDVARPHSEPGLLLRTSAPASTESRALNNLKIVKTSTRLRVLRAAEELNYHPNLHARF